MHTSVTCSALLSQRVHMGEPITRKRAGLCAGQSDSLQPKRRDLITPRCHARDGILIKD